MHIRKSWDEVTVSELQDYDQVIIDGDRHLAFCYIKPKLGSKNEVKK